MHATYRLRIMAYLMAALRRRSGLALLGAALLVSCGGQASSEAGTSGEHGGASGGRPAAGGSSGGAATNTAGSSGISSGGDATNGGAVAAGGAAAGSAGASGGDAGDTSSAGFGAAGDDAGAPGSAGASGGAGNAGVGGAGALSCDPLVFADPNVELVVRRWLGKPQGALTPEDARLVTELDGSNANIGSLSGIECLPLEHVYLNRNHVSDLAPLAALAAHLTTVDLSGNPLLDLSPLEKLDHLVRLELNDVPRVLHAKDLGTLVRLPTLTVLNLRGDTVDTVGPLQQIPTLRTINLFETKLSSPESLSTLKQLRILELSAALHDLTPIQGLTGLTYLGLEANGLSDISALKGLTRLSTIDLSENELTDITVLAGMPLLEDVSLNDNHLVDLTPLGALPNLNQVQLDKNAITSLTPLADNPGLDVLDFLLVNDNPLDCQQQSGNFAKLKAKGVQILSDCL